ncbi:hypothetical protein LINGRAHAP2_LOCUS5876 [Linum grandiflorum]
MGCNFLGLWVFDGYKSTLIRWLSLLFLLRTLSWNINMRRLFSNSRRFAAANRKFIFLIFTAKQIIQLTIWLILVILSRMRCIFLILQIGYVPLALL